MVGNSAGKAKCVAVKRWWCRLSTGIVALGKRPAGFKTPNALTNAEMQRLGPVVPRWLLKGHTPQCTVQTRLLTHDEGAKSLPLNCC